MGLNYPDFLRMLQAELEELDYLGGGEGRDCRKQGPGTNGTFSLSSQVEAALGVAAAFSEDLPPRHPTRGSTGLPCPPALAQGPCPSFQHAVTSFVSLHLT